MNLLLGPALGLVLSSADLGALNVTVLDQGSPAHLHGLVEGNLLVVDEAVLPVVLLALLLLLGLVVGLAPPVVGMVTLDNLVVLGLLHHLNLVDATLAVGSGSSRGNGGKGDISIISLTLGTLGKGLGSYTGTRGRGGSAGLLGVEGESVEQRSLITLGLRGLST